MRRRRLSCEKSARLALAFALACALTGCKKDLYQKQTENDANEMVAALLARGLNADKVTPDDGKTFNVVVDESQVVAAMNVLHAEGLPHEKTVTLGDMFKKDGLISTPTEERVRFVHGVSQELSSTLAQIDGVIVARVQIVIPNNDPLAANKQPASASVFVKYRPEADLTAMAPAIKSLVAHSVEGLTYDNVTVTLVPGSLLAPVLEKSSHFVAWLLGGLGAAVALCGLAMLVLKRPDMLPAALRSRLPAKAVPADTGQSGNEGGDGDGNSLAAAGEAEQAAVP